MKRPAILLSFAAAILFQNLSASPKTDSIYAFLGNRHAKAVWTRWAWCKDDYTPKAITTAQADLSSIEFLDTRQGTQRSLATKVNNPCIVRISKSGKWVTYIDASNTSYIVDLTNNTSIPKVLMARTTTPYWLPGAWWIDPANGDEYLFCLDHESMSPRTGCGRFLVMTWPIMSA